MATHARVISKPLPVSHAIHWMPVRETHHIVASLQHRNGGRRQLFARQEIFATLNAIRLVPSPVFGLLFGELYECPATGVDYLVIATVGDHATVKGDSPVHALGEALASLPSGRTNAVMGWYCVASGVAPASRAESERLASDAAGLLLPWQTTLAVTTGPQGAEGAFFLWDGHASRAFRSPFYELLDERVAKQHAAKPTRMVWPTYSATEEVTPVTPTESTPPVTDSGGVTAAESRPRSRWPFWHDRSGAGGARPKHEPPPSVTAPPNVTATPNATAPPHVTPPPRVTAPPSVTAPAVAPRTATEEPDTAEGDSIERYIAIARQDGFYIAGTFDGEASSDSHDALWVLHDPYTGLLLTVVATAGRVVDASLHYNLHTDDPEVLESAFSEHRNDEAHVIYVRESCTDYLRARCQRARATGDLMREWKVSPTIYFVTPNEWEAAAAHDAGGTARSIDALNRRRIASLPDSITSRHGLLPQDPTQEP